MNKVLWGIVGFIMTLALMSEIYHLGLVSKVVLPAIGAIIVLAILMWRKNVGFSIGLLISLIPCNLYLMGLSDQATGYILEEAMPALSSYRIHVEDCINKHPSSEAANCSNITLPSTAHFIYAFGTPLVNGSDGGKYTLVAKSRRGDGTIFLTKRISSKDFTCSATGSLEGFCR